MQSNSRNKERPLAKFSVVENLLKEVEIPRDGTLSRTIHRDEWCGSGFHPEESQLLSAGFRRQKTWPKVSPCCVNSTASIIRPDWSLRSVENHSPRRHGGHGVLISAEFSP